MGTHCKKSNRYSGKNGKIIDSEKLVEILSQFAESKDAALIGKVVSEKGVNSVFHRIAENEIVKIRKKYNLPKKFIMFLGTIEPRKNLVGLLKAYSSIHTKIEHKLVIVGGKGWKYSNIFETIEKLQIKDKIIFTGFVATGDLPAIYSSADIFVYPSFYEGFGIPLLESMACGTPVMTSDISSMPEVVGDVALLFDPYSVEDIAEKILKLARDNSMRNILSEEGIERAKKFSWEKSARKILNIYKKVIEE
ncbi:glycosyltransferase family 4 protein [bacterium]|nr:glycosyltransferase family 4 protein [bacterium]